MTTDELIGRIAARYLHDHLSEDESDGVARYLLDCLTSDQTAEVAKAVLRDDRLKELVEIKLPIRFVGSHGLPENCLTNERTTFYRNAACARDAILLANVGDDEQQGLKELVPIGAQELQAKPELWVELASESLPLTEQHRNWWTKALTALLDVRSFALDRFAGYVLRTAEAVRSDGHPIRDALGFALPALRIPKDTAYFSALNDKTSGHASRWRSLFAQAIRKRACYLLKQNPTQALLLEEDLRSAFEKDGVKEALPEAVHPDIEAFIQSDSGWNETAETLANYDWERDCIKHLFDGLKPEKFNLGKATLEFYEEDDPDLLTDDEQDYLKRLAKHPRSSALDEDEEFYRAHRNELKENSSLKSKWDRFIFKTPIESNDFLVGIAMCLERLFDRDIQSSKRKLKISCDRRTKRDLKDLNEDAGLFFAARYRGLKQLFGRSHVSWDTGELMNFNTLSKKWREPKNAKKRHTNTSTSKSALRLKFFLELEVELTRGGEETHTAQLIWNYSPNSIASEFHKDWGRLASHPLLSCSVGKEPVSSKGRFQSLDLHNVKSLYPAYGQARGSLVPTHKRERDVSKTWPDGLQKAESEGLISEVLADELEMKFKSFYEGFKAAINGFIEDGLAFDGLEKQADEYGELLGLICEKAKGDRNREYLLRPLMEIGIVRVDGGDVSAVVAPWNPLRLSAISKKANQVASLVKHLLTCDEVLFGDPPLFFKELEQELRHPFYPEIVLGWVDRKANLLSLSDYHLDYSLHESPVLGEGAFEETNENPSETAGLIVELTKRFLSLYPHERANMSVVLYDCDSARLPFAVVDRLGELNDDEDDMRCQIVLRHRDGLKLRELYEKIIGSSESDPDSYVSSEVARDFMARLRIGIMADQAPVPDPQDGPPADVVILQDVIARHANVEWYSEPANPIEADAFVPTRWSRRRPSATDDMKSVVYLACPVQTKEGWAFATALSSFMRTDWDASETNRLLPARMLDFNDPETSSIFTEVHNLGNWVVNYDELLDRRQLLNQKVKVIRYKQGVTHGRNVLISSTAPINLLKTMVYGRVKSLNLELSDEECHQLTDRFVDDANEISGDLVLRAAKRGRNASELMGVVLSRFLIRHELGKDERFGWYFLDDYAEWLGQKEEQIADILAMCPYADEDGKLKLGVVISEAKYIDASGLSSHRKDSQKQLRDTVRRITDAVFGNPKRLDRNLWLSRFSDLMMNGIRFPAHTPIDLSGWRRSLREGDCLIHLRGYSHVFVSGPSDDNECSECVAVADSADCYQEVFSRAKLREVVLAYHNQTDPMEVRRGIAEQDHWTEMDFRKPSDPMTIIRTTPPKKKPVDEKEKPGDEEQPPQPRPTPPKPEPEPAPKPEPVTVGGWASSQFAQLLSEQTATDQDSGEGAEWLNRTEHQCKAALQQFQLNSKLLDSTLTPNAGILKFQGSANLTVEHIQKRRSQFLTTHGLDLVSVRAEPGVVSVAVARPDRQILSLSDIWKKWTPSNQSEKQELLIAVNEDNGQPIFLSPKANAPHTLIAGSTGSGKSVLMQNIILGIAATNSPEQANIILIDPKMVDYLMFEDLPHLKHGVIDEQEPAVVALNGLIEEMNRRYTVLKQNRVRDIFELNRKPDATERLPFLWVIHDEFAEWMMVPEYSDAVTTVVARLGVKARAAGISLVFAAQRPDKDVLPMQLRSNLGNRIVLRVDGEGTSEIALGEKGAERLLGKGHAAIKLDGLSNILLGQVPLADERFVKRAVRALSPSCADGS